MGKVVLEALFTSNAAQTNFDYDSRAEREAGRLLLDSRSICKTVQELH